jgi:RNA polymerase sigma-70 factor (ECF subfamily)
MGFVAMEEYPMIMNDDPVESDEILAARAQNGDTQAFGTLVERYEQKLLRYGRKFISRPEDIEDIVQTAFMSSYQNIRSFDVRQRFSPWMYRIAHNAFVNALRKNTNSFITIDFDTFISHPVYDDPAQKEREVGEMRSMIDKGLEQLSAKYREVLILYYLEEMPYKDIATVLQVPVSTVGVRITRAKKELKTIYEKMQLSHEFD